MTAPLDLAAILEEGPPARTAILELERIDFTLFGVGEMLDLSRAIDVAPDKLGALMRGSTADKGRLMVALAWIIARRREPELTIEDVGQWRIEVRGSPPKNPTGRAPRKRTGPTGSSASPGQPA